MARRERSVGIRLGVTGGQQTEQTFERVGSRGQRSLERIERSSQPAARGLQAVNSASRTLQGTIASLAAALSVRQLVRFGQGALDTAESIADVANQAGVSAERLQGLRFAFDQTGGSAQQMDEALLRFNRRVGLAAEGSGAASNAVERLGIQLRDAGGALRSNEAILEDVTRAISGLESEAERAAVASQFFGERAGPALAPLLAQGTDALDAFADRLRESGSLMSDDLVASGAEASASLRALRGEISTAFQTGILESFQDGLGSTESAMRDIRDSARDLGEIAGSALTAMADAAAFAARNLDLVAAATSALVGGRTLGRLGAMVGGPKGGAIGVGLGTVVGALGGCAVVTREQEVPA